MIDVEPIIKYLQRQINAVSKTETEYMQGIKDGWNGCLCMLNEAVAIGGGDELVDVNSVANLFNIMLGEDSPCCYNDYDDYMLETDENGFCENGCGNHDSVECWAEWIRRRLKDEQRSK